MRRVLGLLAVTVLSVAVAVGIVHAAPADYDANGDGFIDRSEVLTAINDYLFSDTLSREEAIEIITHYLFGDPVAQSDADARLTSTARGQCSAYDATIDWMEASYPGYSICYTQDYVADVEFVKRWIDHAAGLTRTKYKVDHLRNPRGQTELDLYIMLLPEPNDDADTSTTRFKCCYDASGALSSYESIAQIPYLTPSHPEWGTRPTWGQLGYPPDDFHAKNLVHEFTHAGQFSIWGFQRTVPYWVSEGLAEYEGMFNSTEYNRTAGFDSLVRYVHDRIPDRIYCCQTLEGATPTFGTSDGYFGGALIMKFLADTYGEQLHVRLVRHQHSTFIEAVAAEIEAAGSTVPQAFDDMKAWITQHRQELR